MSAYRRSQVLSGAIVRSVLLVPSVPSDRFEEGTTNEGEYEESRLVHKQTRDDSAEQKTNGHFESRMTL